MPHVCIVFHGGMKTGWWVCLREGVVYLTEDDDASRNVSGGLDGYAALICKPRL